MMQWREFSIGVATESQRGEVTSPGPHSWSEAKLHFMWSQSPPVLVLHLLAIAKGWEFSSVCILWPSQVPHKSTQRAHDSGLPLSSSPLGSVLSLSLSCSTTWNIIPSLPPAFHSSSANHSAQELSPCKWGYCATFCQQRDHVFQLVGLPRLLFIIVSYRPWDKTNVLLRDTKQIVNRAKARTHDRVSFSFLQHQACPRVTPPWIRGVTGCRDLRYNPVLHWETCRVSTLSSWPHGRHH